MVDEKNIEKENNGRSAVIYYKNYLLSLKVSAFEKKKKCSILSI